MPFTLSPALHSVPWRRLFWLGMVCVHTPALVGSLSEWASGGYSVRLTVFCLVPATLLALFALKTLDVAFLRLQLTRRACIAIGVIVALLHVNVVTGSAPEMIAEFGTLVATTCVIGHTFFRCSAKNVVAARRHSHHDEHQPVSVVRVLHRDEPRPHFLAALFPALGLRAPPV